MPKITRELKAKLLAAKSAEEVVELLKADGREVPPEDAKELWEEITRRREEVDQKLSLDELEAVSGGALWFGEDAPDGHEINCVNVWYEDWTEFYAKNMDVYCWNGRGQTHEYGDIETIMWGPIGEKEPRQVRICKLCGHWMYVTWYNYMIGEINP